MAEDELEVAAALIFDGQGRLFVQRRSAQRNLFPNCWDIVGGHVEPGESPPEAMRREVFEETGWRVTAVHGELEPTRWRGDDGRQRLEYDYLVSVDGDLDRPRLEPGKHSEWKWITAAETGLLDQHLRQGDALIKELVRFGFDKAQQIGLSPSFAAVIAPIVDRTFIGTMKAARDFSPPEEAAAGRRGGFRDLLGRYGLTTAGPLIDYRLILPARPLAPSERDVINRYADPGALHRGFLDQQAQGTVTVAADGTVTVTERGQAFYRDLWELHDRVACARLRAMPVLAEVLQRFSGSGESGAAFDAVYPPYVPEGASPEVRAFAGLAALRYQRADAHAAAWSAAGLTAAEIVAMPPGPRREEIEAQTNRIARVAFRDLSAARRFALLDEVSEPGADQE